MASEFNHYLELMQTDDPAEQLHHLTEHIAGEHTRKLEMLDEWVEEAEDVEGLPGAYDYEKGRLDAYRNIYSTLVSVNLARGEGVHGDGE